MAEIDEFAQTRGADDLFDDEIIPVSAGDQSAQVEVVPTAVQSEPSPSSQEVNSSEPPTESPRESAQRGRGDRGRGRGRGRGQGPDQSHGQDRPKRGGLENSRWADKKPTEKPSRPKGPKPAKEPATTTSKHQPQLVASSQPEDGVTADQNGRNEEGKGDEATTDNQGESQRVPAVRGDRSATGGLRKPKLTEEELSKRIAAAKENAAKKAAAHARAEADHASFLEREQVAAEKRRQEAANRRVMDSEREQNRQRKLKAQTGREWDSQKTEDDYNPRGGGSQFRRGMHGGVSGYTRRDFDERAPEDAPDDLLSPGRGRGRGGRGGRGRGRGSSQGRRGDREHPKESSDKPETTAPSPAVHNEGDFPALPAGKKPEAVSRANEETKADPQPSPMEKLEASMAPMTGTWADELDD
ncbi:hypothetical protein PDE_08771 [Penicillium oxalicum 114-2]|uniref:Uncharacterized protein n=1 Tax=Penicillium oxalicum (strain 114-2 / CGMCC 5302) TaxID=933388 RepID=S7ZTR7_PENO1|nr:hypothetical protein PDE_08771 [Penicillium oxalicum 114-2]